MTTPRSDLSSSSFTPHRRVEIYDTTLRDGAQGKGVAFSLSDKLKIAQHLDALGVDFIEGGFPFSNPKDQKFFEQAHRLKFKRAKVCAFGMTRRRGHHAADDPGIQALIACKAPVITLVGKTWDLHVDKVLGVSLDENLDMIRESVAACLKSRQELPGGGEVFYDAEHFFDGYRSNPDYALKTLRAAVEGGATRLVLCDTNGGSLPSWIQQVVSQVIDNIDVNTFPSSHGNTSEGIPGAASGAASEGIGIHCHNDCGLAVANSLAAVEVGAVQVQGTINGIGERCGNVDLTTVVANLRLKMGYQCLNGDSLGRLTETSRFVYGTTNMNLQPGQPFVGSAAFAHKGGMHGNAVLKLPETYEHIDPKAVGNTRQILVSELSGISNIAASIGPKFDLIQNKDLQRRVLQRVQDLEHQGYQFEAADASFELLLHEALGTRPQYWDLDHYRCVILRRGREPSVTEATVKLEVNGRSEHQVAEGDGPINALDSALRKCLGSDYPQLAQLHLRDYKVRVVNPTAESAAKVLVMIEFAVHSPARDSVEDGSSIGTHTTIGVNENIIDASWQAITDAFTYHLINVRVKAEGA